MPKNFIKILSLIIFTQIFCCTVFLIPVEVNAIEPYKFQVPIGDLKEITFEKKGTTKPIADYIQAIYKYAIGVVAILATVVMMIGGVVWITAGGNQTRVGEAKQYISGSLTGMVLVFCSYMILNTINPDLVKFKPVGIETVDEKKPETKSDDRHGSCSWEIAQSCYDNDKDKSEGYCNTENKPENSYSICCCKIAPILGCTWETDCNTKKDSNIADCGTVEHEDNKTRCCCTK
ncbi:hypothetical protein KAJ61_05965 [Candidatus Parcubacteria bacterium]|nr:hypothetical protein [Candidatus Parcubacteria bacterium]